MTDIEEIIKRSRTVAVVPTDRNWSCNCGFLVGFRALGEKRGSPGLNRQLKLRVRVAKVVEDRITSEVIEAAR